MKRSSVVLVALVAALAIPGVASANNPVVSADCDGLDFNMPATIGGTVILITLDQQIIAAYNVTEHGQPIVFTLPNPSPGVAHTWGVIVNAPGDNEDDAFRFDVGTCTTDTAPTMTTIAVDSTVPVTSVTDTTTPTVLVGTPPAPRPADTTTTTPTADTTTTTPALSLPETGSDGGLLIGALALLAFGVACLTLARRR